MSDKSAATDAAEIRKRAKALHDIPITPENTAVLRAELLALLADVLASDYLHGWNGAGRQELAQAERLADAALRLDSNLALAHYANGFVERAKGQHERARDAFDRALQLDGGFAAARAQKANELLSLGQAQAALNEIDQVIGTGSNNGTFHWIRGRIRFFLRDYNGAVESLTESVQKRQEDWYNRVYLVAAHHHNNDPANARKTLAAFLAISKFSHYTVALVKQNEDINPNSNPHVRTMRDLLRDALTQTGLPPT